MQDQPIPPGLCQCGCGQRTTIRKYTDNVRGWKTGDPARFVNGHSRRRPPSYEVQNRGYISPCWIWQGYFTPAGYGRLDRDGPIGAHRYFYEEAHGPIPSGLHLDHLCRIPACVNPDHLEPVTSAENVRRGANAKLTWADVDAIRERAANGCRGCDLAHAFGVSPATVSEIVNGRTWRRDESSPKEAA